MKKRSVKIAGHSTSVSLEDEFWTALQALAVAEDSSLKALITRIDDNRKGENLSSALRLYVLRHLQAQLNSLQSNPA
ncbi:MAG: ribbon-helix-helix domain-containing protein [Alphaproteobacteria bacterium]|nr:ribbon-helix-helix domain-containing protein [Alphaproteobacteria bacterium]